MTPIYRSRWIVWASFALLMALAPLLFTSSLGISVLSSHALHGHAREHGVSVLPVQGFPLESRWHIVHPKGKRLSPIASIFKAHLLAGS